MAVSRCKECQSELELSMVSFETGIWMCTNKLCNFPLNSTELARYVEPIKRDKNVTARSSEQPLAQDSSAWRCPRKTTKARSASSSSTASTDGRLSATSNDQANRNSYPLWMNEKSNLCWLDTTLALLITNQQLRQMLMEENGMENKLKVFMQQYMKCKDSFDLNQDYASIKNALWYIRNDVWKVLQPKMVLSVGQLDSPVFSLPLLFKLDPRLSEMAACCYEYKFQCKKCGFQKQSKTEKCLLSIPSCESDFDVPNRISFARKCFKCRNPNEMNHISFEKPSDFIVIHCTSGFMKVRFWKDYFPWNKMAEYFVSHIIQYTGCHYILWSFDLKEEMWLKADDLEHPVCCFSQKEPNFPANEANIVVWQRAKESTSTSCGEKNYEDKLLETLTINSCSSSSSSSSSLRPNLNLETTARANSIAVDNSDPTRTTKWLQKAVRKPIACDSPAQISVKHVEQQSTALCRYQPYVSKRRNRVSRDEVGDQGRQSISDASRGDRQDTVVDNVEFGSDTRKGDGILLARGRTEENANHQHALVINEDVRCTFDKKEILFDSAYSSPISDASDVNKDVLCKSASGGGVFDAAMNMVEDLFGGADVMSSNHGLDPVSLLGLQSQDNFGEYFGSEIDMSKLL